FPAIRKKIRELGASYIFNELERCNLTLVREFYTNWDTIIRKEYKGQAQRTGGAIHSQEVQCFLRDTCSRPFK
ncbi:hypothetical protein HAX54_051059, partial [Datura stramonium]|nr:hypothetical protein [Datura stramonium]